MTESNDQRVRKRRLTAPMVRWRCCPLCGREIDPESDVGCVCVCPVHGDYFENCDCEREEYVE